MSDVRKFQVRGSIEAVDTRVVRRRSEEAGWGMKEQYDWRKRWGRQEEALYLCERSSKEFAE